MQGAHQCPCEFLKSLSFFELLNSESDRKVYLQDILFIKGCISSIQSVFVEMFFVACSILLNRYKKVSELKCSKEITVPAEVVAVVVAAEEAITADQER